MWTLTDGNRDVSLVSGVEGSGASTPAGRLVFPLFPDARPSGTMRLSVDAKDPEDMSSVGEGFSSRASPLPPLGIESRVVQGFSPGREWFARCRGLAGDRDESVAAPRNRARPHDRTPTAGAA